MAIIFTWGCCDWGGPHRGEIQRPVNLEGDNMVGCLNCASGTCVEYGDIPDLADIVGAYEFCIFWERVEHGIWSGEA